MSDIKAADVMKLRKVTGSGMMDCKKALVAAAGDFDKAIEILRKKGQKVAAKRVDRDAVEGASIAVVNEACDLGVGIVLSCETDFVGKNKDFVALAKSLAKQALDFETKEALLASDCGGITVEEKLMEQTGVIGEKIEIKSFQRIEAPYVAAYVHAGNRIASLAGISASAGDVATVAKDVAMQVAAMNPIALDESGVDAAVIEKEVEIAKDQLRKEGKPEAMLDKIVKGKIKRFFRDNTLVNQAFVKDSKQTVAQYVQQVLGADVTVSGFLRITVG